MERGGGRPWRLLTNAAVDLLASEKAATGSIRTRRAGSRGPCRVGRERPRHPRRRAPPPAPLRPPAPSRYRTSARPRTVFLATFLYLLVIVVFSLAKLVPDLKAALGATDVKIPGRA